MTRFIIEGRHPLEGDVYISGMKNSALPILFASVLTHGPSVIENVPKITDITGALEILTRMGAEVEWLSPTSLKISTDGLRPCTSDPDLVSRMRASTYLLGAELGRYGKTRIGAPGGCAFDVRPIDRHIACFESMKAKVDAGSTGISAYAEHGKMQGAVIHFSDSTVGGTVNCMLAAVLASGETVIHRAAKEPHIVDLQNYLNLCGADISGAGTDVIRIRGVEELHGCTYRILPDMIEAGTFLIAAAATGGRVTVHDVVSKHLESLLSILTEMGVTCEVKPNRITVSSSGTLSPISFVAEPYPYFPTDLQPQLTTLCCLADRDFSTVTERIYKKRFAYTAELEKMGVEFYRDENTAKVFGRGRLHGATVLTHDLRAGAAMIIAGLAADGRTEVIDEKSAIARGYLNLAGKLRSLGAKIEEV